MPRRRTEIAARSVRETGPEPWTLRLRRLADEKQLTAPDLARMTGLGEWSIYKYLQATKDTRTPNATIGRLAKALGVSEIWLRTGFDFEPDAPILGYIADADKCFVFENKGPSKQARIPLPTAGPRTMAFEVTVPEYEPSYRLGDVVIGERYDGVAISACVNHDCVVSTRHGNFFSRLRKGKTAGVFDLESCNGARSSRTGVKVLWAVRIEWIHRR